MFLILFSAMSGCAITGILALIFVSHDAYALGLWSPTIICMYIPAIMIGRLWVRELTDEKFEKVNQRWEEILSQMR